MMFGILRHFYIGFTAIFLIFHFSIDQNLSFKCRCFIRVFERVILSVLFYKTIPNQCNHLCGTLDRLIHYQYIVINKHDSNEHIPYILIESCDHSNTMDQFWYNTTALCDIQLVSIIRSDSQQVPCKRNYRKSVCALTTLQVITRIDCYSRRFISQCPRNYGDVAVIVLLPSMCKSKMYMFRDEKMNIQTKRNLQCKAIYKIPMPTLSTIHTPLSTVYLLFVLQNACGCIWWSRTLEDDCIVAHGSASMGDLEPLSRWISRRLILLIRCNIKTLHYANFDAELFHIWILLGIGDELYTLYADQPVDVCTHSSETRYKSSTYDQQSHVSLFFKFRSVFRYVNVLNVNFWVRHGVCKYRMSDQSNTICIAFSIITTWPSKRYPIHPMDNSEYAYEYKPVCVHKIPNARLGCITMVIYGRFCALYLESKHAKKPVTDYPNYLDQ